MRHLAIAFSAVAFVVGHLTGAGLDRYSPSWFDWIDKLTGATLIKVEPSDWPVIPCNPLAVAPYEAAANPARQPDGRDPIDARDFFDSGQAGPYRVANLDLTFTRSKPGTALIDSITPVVYHSDDNPPSWGLVDLLGGCGGSDIRVLQAWISDKSPVVLDQGQSLAGELKADLADTFTVSEDDPVVVRLQLNACNGRNYSFGLDVKYTLHGSQYHMIVGTKAHPYRLLGAPTPNLWAATGEPGANQIIEAQETQFEQSAC